MWWVAGLSEKKKRENQPAGAWLSLAISKKLMHWKMIATKIVGNFKKNVVQMH